MGSRGPQPLPSNVHHLRGNPSKKSAADLLDDFNPEVEIPSAPKWIWPEARKEWRRVGHELERYGLISKLDRAALVLYCQAWARLVWAETMLTRAMKIAEEKREAAEAAGEEWKGGDGIMVPSPNGSLIYSHHWVVQRRSAQEVHWYLQSFGLSPSSRSRVRTSDNRQAALFEQPGKDAWNL
jgi:P27 family predicted phage terminase small subunit